ncbi:hypothetical protein E2C01_058347 [Portunus trituberculatus]|uniref:Uncharacterized protein n=1 Tax=Portunus trituberculatus TaxID=210409 RepID=A0A5B7H2X1_PORTR|nr:hypothetical protein [Portunus trituberculatus]
MSQAVEHRREVALGVGGGSVNMETTTNTALSPFYIPPHRKTSAQIIREARASLGVGGSPSTPILTGVGVPRVGATEMTSWVLKPVSPASNVEIVLSPLHFDTSDSNGSSSGRQAGTGAGPRLLLPIASAKLNKDGCDKSCPRFCPAETCDLTSRDCPT